MGAASRWVNWWACIWTAFVTVIFILPTDMPVTLETMNYAVVFLVGILAFSAIYWYARGKGVYTGPLIETDAMSNSSESVQRQSAERASVEMNGGQSRKRRTNVGEKAVEDGA